MSHEATFVGQRKCAEGSIEGDTELGETAALPETRGLCVLMCGSVPVRMCVNGTVLYDRLHSKERKTKRRQKRLMVKMSCEYMLRKPLWIRHWPDGVVV